MHTSKVFLQMESQGSGRCRHLLPGSMCISISLEALTNELFDTF